MDASEHTQRTPQFDPDVVARKIQQYFELTELNKELALAGIRYRNPGISDEEALRLFAKRLEISRAEKWGGHSGS